MQPVRTMVSVLFAAAILVTGCAAHTSTDQPSPAPPAPNLPHAPRLPIYRSGPPPLDRQAPIYAVVLRQYLAGGGGHDGGGSTSTSSASASGGGGAVEIKMQNIQFSPKATTVRRPMTQGEVEEGIIAHGPEEEGVAVWAWCAARQ